ncbi:non-ribosomal peptide synthetase [Streptomyces sp. NPDC056628]|uniref:non-ribosomal peptide synthetase n=1 Tax=Streptomyces sp. NPDC056628 TaxID=3345882 RepID=UPI00369854A5
MAQLYARDVPDLRSPQGADLLQVLWCPFDHPIMPRTALFWRDAATVTDVLTMPPEPPAMQFPDYLPEPCLLHPEQVTDYPDHLELSRELQGRLKDWTAWQTSDAADSAMSHLQESFEHRYASGLPEARESEFASFLPQYYDNELAGAPGWKVGGRPRWGATDPCPRTCPDCGHDMDALLTIATFEDNAHSSWQPYEPSDDRSAVPDAPRQPTSIQIGSGYDQQLYICPASAHHRHLELMH